MVDGFFKQSNSSKVLRYLFRNQPDSRTGISEALGISPALITASVSSLVEKSLILDLGEAEELVENCPGRRRSFLGINSKRMVSIGVFFSERIFSFCVTFLDGKIIDLIEYVPTKEQISHVNQEIIVNVQKLIQRNNIKNNFLVGVGVAVPGQMNDDQTQFITLSNSWGDFSPAVIAKELKAPIICENNVRAMAYGEYFFNASGCPENFIFIHVGAGIFCANVINGNILSNRNSFAGEIGYAIVNPNGRRAPCGKYGCLQSYASEGALLRKSKLLFESSDRTVLHKLASSEEEITLKTILTAYSLDDEMVCSFFNDAVEYLGICISNTAIVTGTQKIFLHGQIFDNSNICNSLLDYVNSQLHFIQNDSQEDFNILPFSRSRAAIGASAMAIDQLLVLDSHRLDVQE